MTVDELNAELAGDKKDETLAALKTAGYRTPDEVLMERSGVDVKNKQLLKEKKELQEQYNELSSRSETLQKAVHLLQDNNLGVDDPENVDYDSVQKAIDSLRAANTGDGDNGRSETLERELKSLQRKLDAEVKKIGTLTETNEVLLNERDAERQFTSSLLIDNTFKSSLIKEGYTPEVVDMILPALRAKSSAQIQVNEETGVREAIVDDGGTIEAYVALWKDSEQGKALRMAPVNSGGGAGGGAGGNFDAHKAWKDYTPQEKTDLFRSNPEAYRRLRDSGKAKR